MKIKAPNVTESALSRALELLKKLRCIIYHLIFSLRSACELDFAMYFKQKKVYNYKVNN